MPRKGPHQKRLHVTDISGWTHIVKGSNPHRNQNPVAPVTILKPTEVPNGMTITKLWEQFHQCQEAWMASDCWAKLKSIIVNCVLPADGVQITRCVCLGLGSLSGGSRRETSLYQLATLLSVLEILGIWRRRTRSSGGEPNQEQKMKVNCGVGSSKIPCSITWMKPCWRSWASPS